MNVHELAKLVRKMRDQQGKYFRTRTTANLEDAFRLEKQVDTAVDAILNSDLFTEPADAKTK